MLEGTGRPGTSGSHSPRLMETFAQLVQAARGSGLSQDRCDLVPFEGQTVGKLPLQIRDHGDHVLAHPGLNVPRAHATRQPFELDEQRPATDGTLVKRPGKVIVTEVQSETVDQLLLGGVLGSEALPHLVHDDSPPDGILGGNMQVLAQELLKLSVFAGQEL